MVVHLVAFPTSVVVVAVAVVAWYEGMEEVEPPAVAVAATSASQKENLKIDV